MGEIFTYKDFKKYLDEYGEVTSFTIPDDIIAIDRWAFRSCAFLKEVIVPNSVTEIGSEAFAGCESLTNIKISDSVVRIGRGAFMHCESLTDIEIPDSVIYMGPMIFSNCKSLPDIKIPGGVTKIGRDAFSHCESFTNINIPDGVTEIEENAFAYCCFLTNIKIPDGVTKIGTGVFDGCQALEAITYKNRNIKPFMNYNCYGADNFKIIKSLTDNNMLNMNTFLKAVEAEHAGKLDEFCSNYHVENVSRRKKDKLEDRVFDAGAIVGISDATKYSNEYNN